MKKYVVSIFVCLNIFMYSSPSFSSVRSFGHCTKVVTCQIPNISPYPECEQHCSFYVADSDTDDFSSINTKIICEDDGFFCKLNWSGNPHTTISQAEGDKFCQNIFKNKKNARLPVISM